MVHRHFAVTLYRKLVYYIYPRTMTEMNVSTTVGMSATVGGMSATVGEMSATVGECLQQWGK